MPTEEELTTAKDLVEEQARQLGKQEIEWIEDDILRFGHGEHVVVVEALESRPFFRCIYPFNYARIIGNNYSEDEIDTILEDSEYADASEESAVNAGLELLSQQDSEVLNQFEYLLSQRLTSTDASYSFWETDEGLAYGFQVKRRIYPYLDDYSIRDFGDRIQAIVSLGNIGGQFVGEVFDLEEVEASESESFSLSITT